MTGVVVPVGAVGAGGAPLLAIGVLVLVGAGLAVPLLAAKGGVTWLVGSATELPVLIGAACDVLGATLLRLVVTGLEPVPVEPAEPGRAEANPLDDPELAVVGLVKLLVGLVVSSLEPVPAAPDEAEANPLGDPELGVTRRRAGGRRGTLGHPSPPYPGPQYPERPYPRRPYPSPQYPSPQYPRQCFRSPGSDVAGLQHWKHAEVATGRWPHCSGSPHPLTFGLRGSAQVENVPNPTVVTPLAPSTLYVIW